VQVDIVTRGLRSLSGRGGCPARRASVRHHPHAGVEGRAFRSSSPQVARRREPCLHAVVDDDPMKLRASVPERFAAEIRTGQSVRIEDMRERYWVKRFNGARRLNTN